MVVHRCGFHRIYLEEKLLNAYSLSHVVAVLGFYPSPGMIRLMSSESDWSPCILLFMRYNVFVSLGIDTQWVQLEISYRLFFYLSFIIVRLFMVILKCVPGYAETEKIAVIIAIHVDVHAYFYDDSFTITETSKWNNFTSFSS